MVVAVLAAQVVYGNLSAPLRGTGPALQSVVLDRGDTIERVGFVTCH